MLGRRGSVLAGHKNNFVSVTPRLRNKVYFNRGHAHVFVYCRTLTHLSCLAYTLNSS